MNRNFPLSCNHSQRYFSSTAAGGSDGDDEKSSEDEGKLLFPYAFLNSDENLVVPSMLEPDLVKLEMHSKRLAEIIARYDTEDEAN